MPHDHLTLREIGEKNVVRELIHQLRSTDRLLDGLGHDAGFVPFSLSEDEVLVVNTDRSGENLAYKLGLAGPESVGDLAVSHAVSDIAAAGGEPHVLTVSLLLPEHKTLKYAKSLMKGVQTAADRWGMVIASGDTKKNASVAVVVTVIGKAKRSRRLPRSGAKVGDLLVVTGHLGTMFTATLAHQSRSEIPADLERIFQESLENQRPPVELGLAFSRSEIAHACTDISDGLPGAVFDLCNSSEVGTEIEIHKIPVIEKVWRFANTSLELKRESLISANGDWQFLYAIPQKKYEDAVAIARKIGVPISTIGTFTAEQSVTARGGDGLLRYLNRIENDGFFKVNGESYFDRLASDPPLLGSIV